MPTNREYPLTRDTFRLIIVNTSGEYRCRTQQHAGSDQISPLFHNSNNNG